MINSKIYELLKKEGFFNDLIKKAELYFIGNKKILLLFAYKREIDKDIDEIGIINEKGIFIPEFILERNIRDIIFDLGTLNKFFKIDFLNLLTNQKNNCEIMSNNIALGKCYKLRYKLNNNIDNNIDDNVDDNIDNNIETPTEANLNDNQEENKKKEINPYIELMINIYLFEDEIKKKVNGNLKNTKGEFFYLLKKKWMDKLKQTFDYEKHNITV